MSINSIKQNQSALIKSLIKQHGFDYVGFSKAGFLHEEEPHLTEWLKKNQNGKMSYMENHFDKRLDPTKLVEGSKSVISVLFNYYTDKKQKDPEAPKISQYAFGEDYHQVIKDKLANVVVEMKNEIGNFDCRIFVDSAPVLDKAWAKKSGLGWVGKNSNLINKESGSFYFIAEIICDLELEYDGPIKDYCGTCTACIDACPTEAIVQPYVVDGSKCISYFTIELKDEILPKEIKGKMDNWMFGCDVCQDVCPWNSFSKKHQEKLFEPQEKLLSMTKKDWQEITEEVFSELFKRSAVKRTKFTGLKRNIEFLKNQ